LCLVSIGAGWAKWEESELVNSTQGFYTLKSLQPGTEYHLAIIHNNETAWEYVLYTDGPGIYYRRANTHNINRLKLVAASLADRT